MLLSHIKISYILKKNLNILILNNFYANRLYKKKLILKTKNFLINKSQNINL